MKSCLYIIEIGYVPEKNHGSKIGVFFYIYNL